MEWWKAVSNTATLGVPGKARSQLSMPTRLAEADGVGEETPAHQFNENRKLLFLFKIMDTTGLSLIHEETLREINRSLVHLIRQQSFEEIEEFLLTTFKLLKANVRKFPHTSLQCIQVLGGEVFDRGNSRMVEAYDNGSGLAGRIKYTRDTDHLTPQNAMLYAYKAGTNLLETATTASGEITTLS